MGVAMKITEAQRKAAVEVLEEYLTGAVLEKLTERVAPVLEEAGVSFPEDELRVIMANELRPIVREALEDTPEFVQQMAEKALGSRGGVAVRWIMKALPASDRDFYGRKRKALDENDRDFYGRKRNGRENA